MMMTVTFALLAVPSIVAILVVLVLTGINVIGWIIAKYTGEIN